MENGSQIETAVLIHGLARTSRSMSRMGRALRAAGFHTVFLSYPSRKHNLETLNEHYIEPELQQIFSAAHGSVHFVTHSMGGILLRLALPHCPSGKIGRTVLLAPPNHGSEIVDRMARHWWFRSFFGPAAMELGVKAGYLTENLPSLPDHCGIIAGDRSAFHLFDTTLPRPHDGTVSVASTKADGASAHLLLHTNHPFIMMSGKVIGATVHFLQTGRFSNFLKDDR